MTSLIRIMFYIGRINLMVRTHLLCSWIFQQWKLWCIWRGYSGKCGSTLATGCTCREKETGKSEWCLESCKALNVSWWCRTKSLALVVMACKKGIILLLAYLWLMQLNACLIQLDAAGKNIAIDGTQLSMTGWVANDSWWTHAIVYFSCNYRFTDICIHRGQELTRLSDNQIILFVDQQAPVFFFTDQTLHCLLAKLEGKAKAGAHWNFSKNWPNFFHSNFKAVFWLLELRVCCWRL